MIRRTSLTLLAATCALTPAAADPRILTRLYRPDTVVAIHGRAGTQSTIQFGDAEHIENIAVGDSFAWQVTPNKRANLLFVKPAALGVRTNMTVVTDQRTYLFDLVSTPHEGALYMLRFTYPPSPKPVVAESLAVAVANPAPTAPVTSPVDLHFDWTQHGDKRLFPLRAFDDGTSTYLAWPVDATLPAILSREDNGAEGPVNYTVHGGTIVVEGVPAQLILRAGKQVATLTPVVRPAATARQRTAMMAAPEQSRPLAYQREGR